MADKTEPVMTPARCLSPEAAAFFPEPLIVETIMSKYLAIVLAIASSAAFATPPSGPGSTPKIVINGTSIQATAMAYSAIKNTAKDNQSEAQQFLASNAGNVTINGTSVQAVVGKNSLITNLAQDNQTYAMQTLASNVGDVTVNGTSLQLVALDHAVVANAAMGNQTKAVQGLSSNNACFKCE
jgi:hypothetical protein